MRKWSVRRYLVAGVLVWLPILATIWVVSFMLHLMDQTLLLLPPAYRPERLVGFALPGLGAVFALAMLLLTGLLVTNLIGRRLIVYGEELLNRIPVVRSVYGGVKSFTESVFSQSSSFRKVVMVEYPRAGAWEDPRHYHLVLDSTSISSDACVEVITRAAKDLFERSAVSKPSRGEG